MLTKIDLFKDLSKIYFIINCLLGEMIDGNIKVVEGMAEQTIETKRDLEVRWMMRTPRLTIDMIMTEERDLRGMKITKVEMMT